MMKKILLIGVIIIICFIGFFVLSYYFISKPIPSPPRELDLSYFPWVFKKNAVIVIGENASQIEKESAEAIATYLGKSVILAKNIKGFKDTYNLIIVGTPKTNPFLEVVYQRTNATKITKEYPGEGKGILEILENPWNEKKAILLIEGKSGEWKTKVGSETLMEYSSAYLYEKKAHIPLKIVEGAKLEITAPKRCSKRLCIKNIGKVKLTNVIVSIFPTKKGGGMRGMPMFMGKISELGINESKILNASGPIMWILPNVTTLPNEDCGWIVVECDQGVGGKIAYQATPPPAIPRPEF